MQVRDFVLPYLSSPRCPRELREHTGLPRKTVESTLVRATRAGLAMCVTPELRQARLYQLTPIGREWARQSGLPLPAELADELQPSLLRVYSWVQSGYYRRLVLSHLDGAYSVRELRRRILREYQRIGSNHVRATLRDFAAHGLASRNGPLWELTDTGLTMQQMARPVATTGQSGITARGR